jgi:argininosuccinate lyase
LNKDKMMVGYTHFQIAMPSSAGMWLAAYAESLIDDLEFLLAALNICDQNPLGSAAGYGSSFAIDRLQTSKEMQFANLNVNSIYAQMTRGKSEKALATAISFIASTLSKISYDVCLFMSQNFAFIKFPDNLTTGSSIMPHKKNPDVFELIRAKSNILQSLPNQFTHLINNLPVGYHRDYQMTKELLFPAIEQIKELVKVSTYMFDQIEVNDNILQDEKYKYIFPVEEVNKLVQNGVAFRDAYKQIGIAIEKEEFNPDKKINHSHIGSLGNLSNELIQEKFQKIKVKFQK